jgi:hypothetical protein
MKSAEVRKLLGFSPEKLQSIRESGILPIPRSEEISIMIQKIFPGFLMSEKILRIINYDRFWKEDPSNFEAC